MSTTAATQGTGRWLVILPKSGFRANLRVGQCASNKIHSTLFDAAMSAGIKR